MADFLDIQTGGRRLGPGRPALLTAEIGGNHGGDPELARAMVCAAAEAGAGAVKFQAYRAAALMSPLSPYYAELAAEELPFETLAGLMDLARDLGLAAGLTVFDEEGLALAETADFIKIASGDLTCRPLLSAAAAAGRPLFVSTGAADEAEVEAALKVLAPARGRLVVLQCAALYPAPPAAANLAVMAGWLGRGLAAGYSDHTLGLSAARLALALGALVLEKHFTLDRSLPGGDNAISATPGEFRSLAAWAEEIPLLLGDPLKAVQPGEEARLIRRTLVAVRDLPAGTVLAEADLRLLRPPATAGELADLPLPGRILRRPLAAGEPLTRAALDG